MTQTPCTEPHVSSEGPLGLPPPSLHWQSTVEEAGPVGVGIWLRTCLRPFSSFSQLKKERAEGMRQSPLKSKLFKISFRVPKDTQIHLETLLTDDFESFDICLILMEQWQMNEWRKFAEISDYCRARNSLRKIVEPCDKMRTQVLLEILRQDAQISRGSKDCRRALNILTIYTHYSFQVQSTYFEAKANEYL